MSPLNTKISIVIISFNQVDFLEETILSAINQGYQNKEVILIDGGSSDGSLEIIKKYADQFSFCVSEPDKGQADALIKGFSQCNGDLIGWINSDDLLVPGALDLIASKAKEVKNFDGVFYGRCLIIDSESKVMDCSMHEKFNYFIAKRLGPIISQPGTFWGKNAYDSIGGIKRELLYGMDLDLFFNFLTHRYPFYFSGENHAKFRKYPSQKGHSHQFLEKCQKETHMIYKKYGLLEVTWFQKMIARTLQILSRIVNGYYLRTLICRYRCRRSFAEFRTEYTS